MSEEYDPDVPRDPSTDLVEYVYWLVLNVQAALESAGNFPEEFSEEKKRADTLEFITINMMVFNSDVFQEFFQTVFVSFHHEVHIPEELVQRLEQDSKFADIVLSAYDDFRKEGT